MKNILEIKKTTSEIIMPNKNIIFDVATPLADEIDYNPITGIITLKEIGQYSIRWWIATETSLKGCIQFAVKSSQKDELTACSPLKRGQLIGFGMIDAKSTNVTLSLMNIGENQVFLSPKSPVTATLTVIREYDTAPTFNVDEVETLLPGEAATVDINADVNDPNNWNFSFGIPEGQKGDAGTTPHIDEATGNWFIGNTNTGVLAKGPKGDAGPPTTTIPFSISKHGIDLATQADGDPSMIAFSGFGISSYDVSAYLTEDEWKTGTITLREDINYGTAFIMPHDSVLKKIHVLFSKDKRYDTPPIEGILLRPFICLAVSYNDDLVYYILPETITYTEPYIYDIDYPKYAIKRGVSSVLNTKIEEGTTVAILAGIKSENSTTELYCKFWVSGGLYFE